MHLHPVFRFPSLSFFLCLRSLSGFCLRLLVSRSLYRARPGGVFVKRWATHRPPFSGSRVMRVVCAFGIFHDIWFLSVKRAGAHIISCLKTVWGL